MGTDELFRDDYCRVTDHDEARVTIQVGKDPEAATPTIVDATELRNALAEYLEADDGE